MPPMPDPDVTRVEAESLERQGFELESGTDYAASADALVKLTSADAPGTVEYIFDLTDGTYQIAVGYADEGDGVGTWSLAKNNIVLGTWTGEFNSGSGGFANFQAAEAVFEDVVLRSGDSLTIGAQANDGEFGRTDYLDFTLIEEAPGPDPDLPSVPLEPGAIDFASVQPASYFGNQDQGAVSISETGATLALQNNAWKSVAFDYEITTNTVLRVTLQSEDTGELLGVGFDDNIDPTDRRTLFHLGGSQSPGDSFWDVSPKYTAGEGSVEYTIMPGDFFTGAMTSLVFVVDDDADASGKATFSNVTVFEEIPEPQQQPFGGTLADLPGRIEAEAYDEGGPGIAYNDSGAGNIGGGDRQSEDVDTQAADDAGGGENVGWIVTGEWLEYTVDAEAGTYDIMLRVASPRADAGNVALSLDGTALGAVDVPTTGAWQSWRTISLNDVSIGEGEQVLRLSFSGPPVSNGMFNLNWIKFKKQDPLEVSAHLVIDPFGSWQNFVFEVTNLSASAAITEIVLTATNSGWDIFADGGAYVATPDVGPNNNGSRTDVITLDFGDGLAPGDSAASPASPRSDFDGDFTGLTGTVTFSNGQTLTGQFINQGDTDDQDNERWVATLDPEG